MAPTLTTRRAGRARGGALLIRIALLLCAAALTMPAPHARAAAPMGTGVQAGSQSSIDVALTSGYAKLGEEIRLVIRASVSGRELKRLETIDLPDVDGLSFGRVYGPSTSSRVEMDGRRRMVSTNTLTYTVPVNASRVGDFEIPRFTMRIDGRDVTVPDQPLALKVLEDIEGSRALVLDLEPLPARVYEGQPYSFDLTIGWSKTLRGGSVVLQVPWWGRQDGVIELEPQLTGAERGFPTDRRGRTELAVSDLGERDRDGSPYQLYRLNRRFVATRPGTVTFPRTVLEVGRGRRQEPLYQVLPAMEIEVVPVPEAGRPVEWTGAMGPIEVSRDAKRRDIDLGDSLELEVSYLGAGNLEFFEAPKLERVSGFERFRVLGSSEETAPFMRTINYEIVPMDADITEVPPIPLSLFDPAAAEFVTVSTEPMTIRVNGTAMGSDDPFAGLGEEAEPEPAPAIRDIDPYPQNNSSVSPGGPGVRLPLWAMLGAVAGTLGARRLLRRRGDPDSSAARARRGAMRSLRRELGQAQGAPANSSLALERFLAAHTATQPGEWIGRSELEGVSDELRASFASLRERLDRAAFQGGASAPGSDEILDCAARIAREVKS